MLSKKAKNGLCNICKLDNLIFFRFLARLNFPLKKILTPMPVTFTVKYIRNLFVFNPVEEDCIRFFAVLNAIYNLKPCCG